MKDLSYRPVFIGGFPASKYLARAENMVSDLARDGLKKDTWTEPGIIIIAKIVGSFRKVIFITIDLVFVYNKTVTYDNILTVGGWSGSGLRSVATLDFNDIPNASDVYSIGYSWFLEGNSRITMRQLNAQSLPPLGNYPMRASGGVSIGPNEPFVIDLEGEVFGNYDSLFRGAEKDYVYTTSAATYVGDGYDPNIWYKERADETNTWKLLVALPRPAAGGNTVFPSWVRGPERFCMTPGENFYIVSDDALGFSYWEIWKITTTLPSTTTPLISFGRDVFGGLSDMNFGALGTNYVDEYMMFCMSEWRDVAGDVSDAEVLFEVTGGYILEFYPGDYLGYSGRTVDQEKRLSFVWTIETGLYGYFYENIQQAPNPENNVPTALFMLDNRGDTLEVIVVYECPKDRTLSSLVINENDPDEILIGESERNDVGGDGEKLFHFKMQEKKQTLVTEGTRGLSGATFVR